MVEMHTAKASISDLILEQLASGEKRLLVLTVAIRKVLNQSAYFKGDLTESVKGALRKLVAANTVIEVEGLYSLTARH